LLPLPVAKPQMQCISCGIFTSMASTKFPLHSTPWRNCARSQHVW